jgi:hypothetical protein
MLTSLTRSPDDGFIVRHARNGGMVRLPHRAGGELTYRLPAPSCVSAAFR